MLKQQIETTLQVKELAECRAFYLDLMENSTLLADGSFLVKIRSGNDTLTLKTENILDPLADPVKNFSFSISADNLENTKAKLENYGMKYSENRSSTILETHDIEDNFVTIKIKKRSFFNRGNNPQKTQKLELP